MGIIKFLVTCYIDIDDEVEKSNKDPRDILKKIFYTIVLLVILFKGEKPIFWAIFNFVNGFFEAMR